jgi:ribulose-5-phosphate 4-epimerase/fuculose-1-phosphate aldolase
MIASLGDKHVLALRNHGIAVCEKDIPNTFMLLWTVQRAAEIQCMSGQAGGPDTILADSVRQRCADDALRLATSASFSDMVFDASVRRMRAEQASTGR